MSVPHNDHLVMPSLQSTMTSNGNDGSSSKILATMDAHFAKRSELVSQFYHRRKSWFSTLRPNAIDRVLNDGILNAAKTECEVSQRLLELAASMKVEACREVADAWLKAQKVETRQQFFEFVTQHMIDLQQSIEARRQDFSTHISARYVQAERCRDMPELYAHYKKSIDVEITATLDWLDTLLDRFRSIVEERLTHYSDKAR